MRAKPNQPQSNNDEDPPPHVYPLFGREHIIDIELTCWCHPIDDDGVIVHNVEH